MKENEIILKSSRRAVLISGIAMGASWMFLYEAYSRIGVSIASLLYYCGPVIVIALSPLLFKEKITANKAVGFLAVIVGVILINTNSFNGKGDVFGIGGAMFAELSKKTQHITVIHTK